MGRRCGGIQCATHVRHCATRSPRAVATRLLCAARQRLSTCAPLSGAYSTPLSPLAERSHSLMGRRRGGIQRATRVRHCATRSPHAVVTRLLRAARHRLSTCTPPCGAYSTPLSPRTASLDAFCAFAVRCNVRAAGGAGRGTLGPPHPRGRIPGEREWGGLVGVAWYAPH